MLFRSFFTGEAFALWIECSRSSKGLWESCGDWGWISLPDLDSHWTGTPAKWLLSPHVDWAISHLYIHLLSLQKYSGGGHVNVWWRVMVVILWVCPIYYHASCNDISFIHSFLGRWWGIMVSRHSRNLSGRSPKFVNFSYFPVLKIIISGKWAVCMHKYSEHGPHFVCFQS